MLQAKRRLDAAFLASFVQSTTATPQPARFPKSVHFILHFAVGLHPISKLCHTAHSDDEMDAGGSSCEKRAPMITKKRISVLMTDDHKLIREGLKTFLTAESDIEVVGDRNDRRKTIPSIRL